MMCDKKSVMSMRLANRPGCRLSVPHPGPIQTHITSKNHRTRNHGGF